MTRLARFLLSFFGCGYAPYAPGTAGTAGALLVAALLLWRAPGLAGQWLELSLAWVFVASAVTVLLVPLVEERNGVKDPQLVVSDEVAGYWLTVAPLARPELPDLVVAFFLFRLLDILKPWPAGWLERLPGGWGVLLDDLMAGVYGAAVMLALQWLGRP